MIQLLDVYLAGNVIDNLVPGLYERGNIREGAAQYLYLLMQERNVEANISHKNLPSFEEHVNFLAGHPYRCWYLVGWQAGSEDLYAFSWAGSITGSFNNEIGIVLGKDFRGRGIGPLAIRQMMALHRPLAAVPSQRRGSWLANIAPGNEHSKHIFMKMGFNKVSETYQFPEEETDGNRPEEAPPAPA